ncbi:hypothetical protein ColKHC_03109 [Colletotrichum higginsianum]|nr:hypothetical protein ColKHC_03109 [Colletotrichum higginsianum]
MTEGLDNDDGYRMVEDELFTIAGQFTAHLHAAEYQRLKAQTRSQNAETIKNISRPVVGSLTELARKRQEELLRKKKQREALRRAKQEVGREDDESGDETGVPWRGTSLQGLMHSRKKQEVPLMALTRADLGTKASSVFGGVVRSQSQRPTTATRRDEDDAETEDESDDLGDLGQAPGECRGQQTGDCKAGSSAQTCCESNEPTFSATIQQPGSRCHGCRTQSTFNHRHGSEISLANHHSHEDNADF